MFNVIFPPGCYGTFLASSIYELTNLSSSDTELSYVDSYGSSHAFRNNSLGGQKINFGHLYRFDSLNDIEKEKTVVILPNHQRWLDYIDNQFTKHINQNIEIFLNSWFGPAGLNSLINKFESFENFDRLATVDRYVLREFISFWIIDVLNSSYGLETVEKYKAIGAKMVIHADDIHNNYSDTIERIAQKFNLITKPAELISQKYNNFSSAQKFHKMQETCDNWLDNFLKGENCSFPGLTIIDEAYVQAKLRMNGFDIKCLGINEWPDPIKLRQLLEPASS